MTMTQTTYDEPHTCLEVLDIPYFLRRNADGSLKYPREITNEAKQVVRDVPVHTPISDREQSELLRAIEDPTVALADKQPIYRELRRREDRDRAKLRIEKFKASLAEKQKERNFPVTEAVTTKEKHDGNQQRASGQAGDAVLPRPSSTAKIGKTRDRKAAPIVSGRQSPAPEQKVVPSGFKQWSAL